MRKLIFALVFGGLLLPDYGFTLGMGEIEVESALNQQLNARIELLSAAPEDAESLIVKLASREEFNRAGIDRPYVLSSLRFSPYTEDGQVYIKVTTPKPVREPYLNFLVEIDWPKGHLLREYTILLDPPVFMGQAAPSQVEQSRPAMSDAPGPAPAPVPQPAGSSDSFRPGAAPVAAPVPAPSQSEMTAPVSSQQQTSYTPAPYTPPSGGYRIQKGDTAWSLAGRMRPDESVSVEQMMLAMLRFNPEVFINENVNGLKRGYILRMPDRNTIDSIGKAEALAEIRQQNALWREYQQTMAAAKPATAMGVDGSAPAYGSGIPSSRSDARLEIVSAGSGTAAAGSSKDPSQMTQAELREQLALAREAVETERVEKEAMQDQISALESQLDNMKGLVNIEDSAMAEIQDMVSPSGETTIPEDVAAEIDSADLSDEEAVMDALDALTGEATEPELAEDMTEAGMTGDETAEADAAFVDEQAELEMAEEAPVVAPKPERPSYMPEPKPEPDLITMLLDNRLVIGGVAVVVLILLGVVYLLIKRRRDAEAEEVEAMLAADSGIDMDSDLEDVADLVEDEALDSVVSDEQVEASMAKAEADAEDEFDADSTMVLPSTEDTIMTEAEESEPEEERDDVIAEADVYLAYGIYQQAEELLKTAITENPDKASYRVKLAETYFASKNAPELSKLGVEMKQQLGGEDTPAWRKVVAMGKELCPDDEIFKQAGMVPDLDIDDLMPKTPEPMDIDLGEDEGEIEASELDLDFDTGVNEADLEMPSLDDTAVITPEEATAEAAGDLAELEFDLSETEAVSEPAIEAAEPASDEDEFSVDIEASELDIEAETALDASEPVVDISDMEMEADVGELDFDIAGADETPVEDISEASLEDVSLEDLGAELEDQAEAIVEEAAPAAMPAAAGLDDELDLSDLGDVDEISTKLDLARAYLDMGDHDGARDILDEVMIDGNDQQKQEAEELIKDLG